MKKQILVFFLLLISLSNGNSFEASNQFLKDKVISKKELNPLGPGCGKCDYSKVWNDVVYVVDTSDSIDSSDMIKAWSSVLEASQSFNIQHADYTASNFSMRVGVVTYASTAKVLTPLGSLNNDEMQNLKITTTIGDSNANLLRAMEVTALQFTTEAHRLNSKMVMVIIASTNSQISTDVLRAANTFKEDGGMIVVFGPSTELKSISSEGYFFNGENDVKDAVLLSQCNANCFCPKNSKPLTSHGDLPTGGCYYPVFINNNYPMAKRNCQRKYSNGYISTEKSSEKQKFNQQGFNRPTSYYIGLQYDFILSNWVWEDGTVLLPGDYQPWLEGQKPIASSTSSCVFVTATGFWTLTDCRNAFYYTCESAPCDTTQYCED